MKLAEGCYLLCSNVTEWSGEELWQLPRTSWRGEDGYISSPAWMQGKVLIPVSKHHAVLLIPIGLVLSNAFPKAGWWRGFRSPRE